MKILRRLFLGLATAVGAFVLAVLCLSIVASIRFYSDRNQAISASIEEPFSKSSSVETIDRRELFFHPDRYRYRVTLEARVDSLRETLRLIREGGSKFEMIYDF